MHLKNFIYLLFSTALTALLNFFVQIYVARYSSAEIFGVFSIYSTIILIMFNAINLGLGHYFIKRFSQEKELNKIEINSLLIFLLSSFFGVSVTTLIFYYVFADVKIFIVFCMSLGVLGYSIHELIQSYYVGIQSKDKLILWQPFLHLLRAITLFLIIAFFGKVDFDTLAIFSVLYSFLIILVVIYKKREIFNLNKKEISKNKIKKILDESIWFGLVGFLYVLYSQFSVIYIGKKLNLELAGYFNIGYTFVLLSLIIPNTFYYKILLPKLHEWMLKDKLKIKKSYILCGGLVFLVGVIVSIVLFFYAEWIIKIFYGEKYLSATETFRIIVLSIPFFYLSIHLGVYSYLGGAQKYKVGVLLLVSIFSLLVNYVSINLYGIYGAAICLILITFFMSILYWCVNHFFLFKKFFRDVE